MSLFFWLIVFFRKKRPWSCQELLRIWPFLLEKFGFSFVGIFYSRTRARFYDWRAKPSSIIKRDPKITPWAFFPPEYWIWPDKVSSTCENNAVSRNWKLGQFALLSRTRLGHKKSFIAGPNRTPTRLVSVLLQFLAVCGIHSNQCFSGNTLVKKVVFTKIIFIIYVSRDSVLCNVQTSVHLDICKLL